MLKEEPQHKTSLPSDAQIWSDFKNGCTIALGSLYDKYVDTLFTYGLNLSKDRGHVKDCIHDVFLELYKYRKKLANTDNVKAYLFKCLGRRIHKKRRYKFVPLQTELISVEYLKNNSVLSCEEELILSENRKERGLKVETALETLTKTQRKGLLLRFNEEKSYEEISRIMNTSIPTARTTIYRSIKLLREQVLLPPLALYFHFFY